MARRLPWILIALAVVGLDRATKSLVAAHLAPYGSVAVLPGLFDLTYVQNPGGVFGIFRNLDDGFRGMLFTVVPLVAIILIALYTLRLPAAARLTLLAMSLILGGACGNLVDRIRLGYVIDFLDFYWRGHHWPAFNVADSAICAGVGILLLETLFVTRDEHAHSTEHSAESNTP